MMIRYETNIVPEVSEIIELYRDAGLKRPVDDEERIRVMYTHANLIITAWAGEELVGVSRALTDYVYCCYLSDLAVKAAYQGKGIGRKLIALTKEACGEQSMLLLLSAPSAMTYYPGIGLRPVNNGFMIDRAK